MNFYEKILLLRTEFYNTTGLEANVLILGVRHRINLFSYRGETKEEAKKKKKALSGLTIIKSEVENEFTVAYGVDKKDLLKE
jgi:hypothetical protein